MAHFSRHNEDYMRKGMADYMHCNHLPELWKTIDQLHLSYLQTDESLDKIEQRTKLEEIGTEEMKCIYKVCWQHLDLLRLFAQKRLACVLAETPLLAWKQAAETSLNCCQYTLSFAEDRDQWRAFCESDIESPGSISHRASYIKEYLCLVPHDGKFCFRETAEVLHQSATHKEDFSGYRAASAWNAIGMYAANLLTQPWRKEYRELKLFCGFYKHEIEANLVGAELMLQAMGYKHTGKTTMVLDGPIDPDRVSSVSRDSLMAFVECQLLKTIWEEVSRRFNCSWLEVLEFRENHVGTPESAAKGLVYHFHHRQYQEQHQHQLAYHPMEAYGTAARFHQPSPASCIYAGYYNYPPYSYTLPQQPRFRAMISPQQALPPVITYPIPPPVHPVAYHHPVLKSQDLYPTNGHHPHQHYAPQMPVAPVPLQNGYAVTNPVPSAPAPVPTGQLIELDMAVPQQNSVPEPPRPMHQHQQALTLKRTSERQPEPVNHSYTATLQKIENQPLTSGKAKEDGTGTFESWDYVFRNLESQGYSKDLGERPDILSPSPEKMAGRNRKEDPPEKDLEETLMELRLEEYNKKTLPVEHRPLKINEALQKIKIGIENDHSRVSPGKNSPSMEAVDGSISAYDNMSSPPKENPERERPVTIATASSKTVSNNLISTSKPTTTTLPRDIARRYGEESDRFSSYAPTAQYSSATLDPKHLRDTTNYKYMDSSSPERTEPTRKEESAAQVESKSLVVSDKDKWECVTCTFLNVPSRDVCEMCGKSKLRGSEVRPLASGGRECPKCTLVNEKGVGICEVCGASLKDSPTYI